MYYVLVATGHCQIDQDIDNFGNHDSAATDWSYYASVKALLPISNKPCISWFYNSLSSEDRDRIIIVSGARNFKDFERWAMLHSFPFDRILCTGTDDPRPTCDTVVDALEIASQLLQSWNPSPEAEVVIVSSDYLPEKGLKDNLLHAKGNVYFAGCDTTSLAMKLSMSSLASIAEYIETYESSRKTWTYKHFTEYISQRIQLQSIQFSHNKVFSEWMSSTLSLHDYKSKWGNFIPFADRQSSKMFVHGIESKPVKKRVHARIGLLGNPSDGFFGKTISCIIKNYWADVILLPHQNDQDESIHITPNQLCDPNEFGSIDVVRQVVNRDGYHGARRIFMAVINLFVKYCESHNIPVHHQGFKVVYHTTIPRQVGLAGSSALATALLKALVEFNHITEDKFPLYEQANLCLYAERDELGITAGYQDRVIQAYGNCIYMDFERSLMEGRGYGIYEPIQIELLPKNMWMGNVLPSHEVPYRPNLEFDHLAYVREAEESGKIHKNIRALFNKGDPEVVQGMSKIAALADDGRKVLLSQNHHQLAQLMDFNFDFRREVYGDAMIGFHTARMVQIARQYGHAAKQSGSGGCVIGLWAQTREEDRVEQTRKMKAHFQKEGYIFSYIEF